jgi:hypothetical protein
MAFSWILLLTLVSFTEAYNGVNVYAQIMNFDAELESVGFYLNDYLRQAQFTGTVSGFLKSISVQNMYFELTNAKQVKCSVSSVNNDTLRITTSFDIRGITYSPAQIKKFLFVSTIVPNLYIESAYSTSTMTFDVKIIPTINQLNFSLNSDISFKFGSKYLMYTLENVYPYAQNYFSSWLTSTGEKLIKQNFEKAIKMDVLRNTMQTALDQIALHYPFSLYYFASGNCVMNQSLSSIPTYSGNYIQLSFDGTIYPYGNYIPITPTVQIPTKVSGIDSNYQYIISQDVLQSGLSTFQQLGYLSVNVSNYFADLNVYSCICNLTSSAIVNFTTNGTIIALNEACLVSTDNLGNFNVTFNLTANTNMSVGYCYYGFNCIYISNVTSITSTTPVVINPAPNVNYNVFANHMNSMAGDIMYNTAYNLPYVPLPTPMAYVSNTANFDTHIYNGYLVVGDSITPALISE